MTRKCEKFWDKNANRFDQNDKKAEAELKEIIAKTSKYLSPNDEVLDFGCATGTKTLALAISIKHIHGLDISSEMIRNANKKKDEKRISNASFSKGNIFDENLKKSSFDKIVAFYIIHLMEDAEKVIERIHDLLKPGGLFISVTACMKEKPSLKSRLSLALFILMKWLGMMPLYLNRYRAADLEKLITEYSLEIIESEMIFHGVPGSFIVARKRTRNN